MSAALPPLDAVTTPQDWLNAALWHATQAVLDANAEAESLDLSVFATAALAEDRAHAAAVPLLAAILPHPKLHQTVARALGAEAVRLVREAGR